MDEYSKVLVINIFQIVCVDEVLYYLSGTIYVPTIPTIKVYYVNQTDYLYICMVLQHIVRLL